MTTGTLDVRWVIHDAGADELSLHVAGRTDVGLVRKHNEDSWLASLPVFLVADGMGGHAYGDVASALVVRAFEPLAGTTVTRADVEAALARSMADVQRLAEESGGTPGTTLTMLARVADDGGQWLVANIGDSRIYQLIGGVLERLTHDHSVVQEMVDAGDIDETEAIDHPDRNIITRSIGAAQSLPPDLTFPTIRAGARILLCSDGICGALKDEEIRRILLTSRTPVAAVDALIDAASATGGHDNATAIVIDLLHAVPDANEDTLGRPLVELVSHAEPSGEERD